MKTKIMRACVFVATMTGGSQLVTTASCDPYTGGFNFFRDDNGDYYYDPGYYDVYVPVCDPYFEYCY